MSVTTTTNKVQYTGTGSLQVFAYPFRIFAASELVVSVNGSVISAANYTVSNVGALTGGNVTFNVAPASAAVIIIRRILPMTQLMDLINNIAPIPTDSIEEAHDRAVMLIQQLNEILTDKVIRLEDTSALSDITVPEGASKYLRWNAAGTALEAVAAVLAGTVVFSAFGETLVGSVDAAAARSNLEALSLRAGEIFGIDAGVTDAYAVTLSPAPTSYTDGMPVAFKANTACTSGSTLNVNGLGAKAIVKNGSIPTATRDILAGQIVFVIFDATLDAFQMISPALPMIQDGSIILENTYQYAAQEAGGTVRSLLFIDAGDNANVGDPAIPTYLRGTKVVLANGIELRGKESGGTERVMLYMSGANVVALGASTNVLHINGSGSGPLWNGTHIFWHADNDGPSSGLDSDLLDGKEGADYVAKDETGAVELAVSSLTLPSDSPLNGNDTGSTPRNIARVSASNEVEIGNAAEALRLLSNGTATLDAKALVDVKNARISQVRGNINSAGGIVDDDGISSITINGTGDRTCVFTTAMGDANYAPSVIAVDGVGYISSATAPTVNSFRYVTVDLAGTPADMAHRLSVIGLPS